MSMKITLVSSVVAVAGICFAGCAKPVDDTGSANVSEVSEEGHLHGEWWCGEHGVPEEICALCDTTLVADFKAKGDWCGEHHRPDSQCFVCHPEKEAEFAALYEAKYGEKPPKPEAAGEEHDHHEHEHEASS